MLNTRILDPISLKQLESKINHVLSELEKYEILFSGKTHISGVGWVSVDFLNFPNDLINRVKVREVIPPGFGTPYEE